MFFLDVHFIYSLNCNANVHDIREARFFMIRCSMVGEHGVITNTSGLLSVLHRF